MNTKSVRRYLAYALNISLLLALIGTGQVHAAFPGTNGKIAFESYRDGNGEIYGMNADGGGQTNLTNNPAGDGFPAWSPDGSRIAFYSDRDGNAEIYVMNANGTGLARLTNNPATDYWPAWSPDGSKIAFYSDRDGNGEIYVMNADGSGQTRLTNNPATDNAPDWSPNGAKIVFNSYRDGNAEIYVMNADGSGQINLSNNNSSDDGSPAWSPDGTQIVFHGSGDGYEIYVMNAEGSGVTRLTFNSETDVRPDWQPLPASNNFSGFFQPVDNLPTLNVVKAGQAIPVKFSLNGDQGLNIIASGYPKSQNIQCDSTAVVDGIEETVTAGSSSLSYNPITDTYTYVWKTDKAWANTCRQLVVKLNDGTYHQANFKFK